jgi:hypothetical protein
MENLVWRWRACLPACPTLNGQKGFPARYEVTLRHRRAVGVDGVPPRAVSIADARARAHTRRLLAFRASRGRREGNGDG